MAIVVVLIALLSGILIGIAGDHAYLLSQRRLMPPSHGSHDFVLRMVERIDRDLNLTPGQKTAIIAILEQRRKQIDGIMTGVRPQVRQVIDTSDAAITALLTPEQRPKFEALRQRMNRRHEHGHGHER